LIFMGSNPVIRQKATPTRDATDAYLDRAVANAVAAMDANDIAYALDASFDYDPAPGLERIRAPLLAVNSADDLINPPELGIRVAGTLDDALDGAAYVQENIRETLEAKRDIFRRMDTVALPETILASSTSTIPASEITRDLAGRRRCLVAHPVNPPHLVPLVE